MKRLQIIFLIFYSIILLTFSLYSYVLIDPNITFINHPLWSRFLELVLQIGYYQRQLSWQIYFILVCLLFIFHLFFIRNYQIVNPIILALIIGVTLLLSYPFLSHDFLKYMFDAKIITVYKQNPYFFRPLDFSYDPWLRFLHWVEQPYRYGPIFLLIIIIPSFLAIGKFLLSFIFMKIVFILFYLLGVYYLNKLNKRWTIIFASHPLILIDGLINGHNDIIGISLLIIGIVLLSKRNIWGRACLLLSVGIKYLTLPAFFLFVNKKSLINKLIFIIFLLLPFSLLNNHFGRFFNAEIHTWYFITLIGFLPFYEEIITKLNIFFFGLLMCYYPFIRFGSWLSWNNVSVKHLIIILFAALNLLVFLILPKWRKVLLNFLKYKV